LQALHEKAAPILESARQTKQDKNPAAVFNKVKAANTKKPLFERLMKRNEKIDERFERGAFNLLLLVGCNLFQNHSSLD
jgi:hypothetical protein